MVLGILGFGAVFGLRRYGQKHYAFLWLLALFSGFGAGFGWADWRAQVRMGEALSTTWEGRDIRMAGTVVSLPAHLEHGQRFVFKVEEIETPDAVLELHVPRYLLLSDYRDQYGRGKAFEGRQGEGKVFQVGERWDLTARLKRPHGSVNPGGYDYEAWLLEQNLRATGYVRMNPEPRRIAPFSWSSSLGLPMLIAHKFRQKIRDDFISRLGGRPYGGILTALAVGDQQGIPDSQWKTFNRTGTTHLISISGLHVSLVAMLVGILINCVWRFCPALCMKIPAQRAALLGAWLSACAYTALAGFAIPAQRACLMLTFAVFAMLSGNRVSQGRILLLALSGVLLIDPWAVLSAGFWLSFSIVAALIWGALSAGGREDISKSQESGLRRIYMRFIRYLKNFGRAQWAAMLASLPLLLWIFHQFPLISPLANFIAIPLVSLIVTPLVLLAALFSWIPGLPLLDVAYGFMFAAMAVMEAMAKFPVWQLPAPELWEAVLSSLGVLILLLPCGKTFKTLGVMFFLPLLFHSPPKIPEGALRVTVLDVGQGQAVLLETSRHRLLYDAGPLYGYGQGSTDAGQRVVLPYLSSRGIAVLDMVLVSHKDKDHSGGLSSILEGVAVRQILSSIPSLENSGLCAKDMGWTWDQVRFEIIYPPLGALKGENDDSCVLKVFTKAGRVLLTGDISKKAERRILREEDAVPRLSAEVMLVPHHGSNTSSTLPFIAAVGPDLALFSAGYRNRYGHPRPEILERYRALDVGIWRTDQDGALVLDFFEDIKIRAWRREKRRYWYDTESPG